MFNEFGFGLFRGPKVIEIMVVEEDIFIWNDHYWHGHKHKHRRIAFEFLINNIKINFQMGSISVVFGTPISGSVKPTLQGAPLDVSAFKAGSVEFASSDANVFTVNKSGDTTFTINQVGPGTATLTATAQNVNGDPLSDSAEITLTPVTPPPPVADGMQISFDGQ